MKLIGQIGALLVGNRTFRGDDPYKGTDKEGKAFGGGWSGPQFVLTHHAPDEHPGGTDIKLERIRLTDTPQATNLWFRVAR